MIHLQLLGAGCLRSGGTPISGPPAQRHRIAMLTLIVDAWPQPLSRERAIGLLWPERDQQSGRRLLNLSVHVLRAALGEATIASLGDGLLFGPATVTCDLHELRAAIERRDHDAVARLAVAPLLDGFHLAESPEFSHWLDRRNAELAQARTDALLALAARHERSGDTPALVSTCRRLVEADPYSATCAERFMRALDAAGDGAAAIRHAAEYGRRVRAELDLEPEPRIAALAAEMRRARTRPPSPAAAMPRLPSVAVLPFVALGGGPEHEYFADGVTEDVIAQLSKIRAINVISRGSVMQFKSRGRNLRQIGTLLGAGTILEGSVRHAGNRVRIIAGLVDVTTERQLWAETYDRELTDIFAIQADVALQIAAALRAELTPDERGRVRGAKRDLLAHQLFLQGRRWHIDYSDTGMRRAAECYERAIARDPGFAPAFANLSIALTELVESGFAAAADLGLRAEAAALSSLRLDPDLAEAHCAIGFVRAVFDRDPAAAEPHFRRALELSPGAGDVWATYGRLLAGWGRYEDAIATLQRSQELDPLVNRSDIATALIRAGRYDEAAVLAKAATQVDLALDRARATLGWAYFLGGQREAGVAELEAAVALSPQNPSWLAQLGEAHGLAGNQGRARAVLQQLAEMARTSFVSPYHLAYVHTGLGELDRALDLLERAVAEGAGPIYALGTSYLLAPLRPHPRFQALLEVVTRVTPAHPSRRSAS